MSSALPTSHSVNYGVPILPIKRVETFSSDDWERLIEEWLDTKKNIYCETERLGGSGDKGTDIAAYVTDKTIPNYIWDCYQAKHYDNPITPSQVYVELAKIIYYSFKGDFPCPRAYYFIAPKGCGTALSTLLKDPVKLKDALRINWEKHCAGKITSTVVVDLTGTFLNYFENFNFSIFKKVPTKTILEEHKQHPNHLTWFGGGLKVREELFESDIPNEPLPNENVYVTQLLLAYGSDASRQFTEICTLVNPYDNHFKRTRLNFHYAEQLRNLYRDSLPIGTFEKFQEEIFDGIVNIYEEPHANGYEKVKAVENQSSLITVSSNPLKDVSVTKDKIGICHQLCNEGKFKWT